jgi:ethanolamine utilization protein EutM
MAQAQVKAVGLIETRGLIGAIAALDTMAKAAKVSMLSVRRVGSGLVTVIISGEVAAVQSAIEAGKSVGASTGEEVVSANVIPRPHPDLWPALFDPK